MVGVLPKQPIAVPEALLSIQCSHGQTVDTRVDTERSGRRQPPGQKPDIGQPISLLTIVKVGGGMTL